MLCVNQVCHGVGCCVKDGSCSSSSLEWKSIDSIIGISYYLNKFSTLSNASQMTTFSFRKTAHMCIVCITQSNRVKMWFSCFSILPGSTEAQVRGGIVRRILIAYFIGNISAEKISKSIHVCESYSKPKVERFLRHGVVRANFNTHLNLFHTCLAQ